MNTLNKTIPFFFFLTLFLLSGVTANAQTNLSQEVEKQYSTLKSWSADFTQTTFVEILGDTFKKKGMIAIARPDKIHIEYKDPEKVYISDGKKLWVYKDNETAWEFDKPKKVISKEALSFLSGLKDLNSLFFMTELLEDPVGPLKIKNKKLKTLGLTPKNKEASVLKIILGISEEDQTVKEAVLYNVSGNVTHYEFKNLVFDSKLDPQLFSLPDKPKRKVIKK